MLPKRPPVDVAAHIRFGHGGNADALLLDGWSVPEHGHIWSIDAGGRLCIPYAPGSGTLVLEIGLTPMLIDRVVASQRISVEVNGIDLGTEEVAGRVTLGFPIPTEALGDGAPLAVTLRHPGALVPAELGLSPDQRRLGAAVHEILLLWTRVEAPFTPRVRSPLPTHAGLADAVRGCTGLDVPTLLGHFESLGHNCEFGLAQRALAAEPLSLLRFAGVAPQNLLLGLDAAFEGIDNAAHLRVFPNDDTERPEYMVRNDRYAVEFHTNSFEGDIAPVDLINKWSLHLRFLQRKFQESLSEGRSVFVLHHRAARTPAQVLPILNVLRSHGPNALLYVTADRGQPPGSVEQLQIDLFHGWIDRLTPMYEAHKINATAWASLCANTYRMWRESGFGG